MISTIRKLIRALGAGRKSDANAGKTAGIGGGFLSPADAWHYEFAHLALRIPFFQQPDFYRTALDDRDKAQALVRATLARIAENRGLSSEAADEIARTIKVHKQHFADGDCVALSYIVEMPPPVRDVECHFVALVFRTDGTLHYLTLERSGSPTSTALCTWNVHGDHYNYGEGPPPDVAAFANEVGRRVCSG